MTATVNPYAAPTARVEDAGANAEAEAIRRAHINHEASIKAVGALYYLGGVLAIVVGVGSLLGPRDAGLLVTGVLFLVIGVAQFFAGWGVRALRAWGRIMGIVLSGLGLLAFPIGTLINGYILYLFLAKKGRTIFDAEYQDVIAATPHIKYRTSIVVWILLALVGALILAAVVAPLFRG